MRHAPLELMIALHYHCYASPYSSHDSAHRSSPAVKNILCAFTDNGLLRSTEEGEYEPTEKLREWVRGLCSVPVPAQKWQIDWSLCGND